MFKSKTVFVVGAGASCEAGLPSGEALKTNIARVMDIRFNDWGSELISGDYRMVDALRAAARAAGDERGNINPYLHKAWRIRDVVPAAAISIDNFLDAHRGDAQMELCGKLGIVKSILDAEKQSKLKPREPGEADFTLRDLSGTWYVGFLQMLTEGLRRGHAHEIFDNVSIITFNYDRCIERFLAQALADYYDFSPSASQEIVSNLRIFHPYGQVGKLPWQIESGGVAFGSDYGNLLQLAGQIKTFTEGLDDQQILSGMHDAVGDAEVLVFLGFAFHPLNMELLTPGYSTAAQRIYATTLGLSDSDEAVIEDDILRMLGKDDLAFFDQQSLKPEMAKMKCGDFFRHYFRSISAAPEG
ncbi:hypothetical protein LQ953_12095 [Sphingomonas sp. IC-56]|uniref:hypothetical protein n=1 Tax=Sphingomonas sp. IC-56 TaxID=2898529 RepID=UPI001E51EA6D|nr:hypothetical protein [Sphingomonas sp. IC-56]MCD2324756.1 hypothetical protein [Sphingomonas sp. IC-56]